MTDTTIDIDTTLNSVDNSFDENKKVNDNNPKDNSLNNKKSNDTVDDAKGNGEKKLSNKELKELKKKEKAAKRAAKKQESGISIEQQKQQAEAKKEKKLQQQQLELQKKQAKLAKTSKIQLNASNNKNGTAKKNSLFSHLETTEERRASILAITSAVSSPRASRITAAGLMVPMVASAVSGARVYTTSSFAQNISTNGTTTTTTSATTTATTGINNTGLTSSGSNTQLNNLNNESVASTNNVSGTSTAPVHDLKNTKDIAKQLASFSLNSKDFSVVPGISSVVPHTMEKAFASNDLIPAVKEILLNKEYIHPAIYLLTTNIAHYKIVGSIPRCIAMLEAFQIVIQDYQTPSGTTLSRNLTNYLSHQIDILKKARPLSVTMGNAIRWLKQEISHIDPNVSDKEAKFDLCEKIAQFAKEKIELADQLIIENASNQIEKNSTIMVYGSSKVITDFILHNAITLEKNIKVIVVDSRPLFEGRKLANLLRKQGVNVIYSLITGLDAVFSMDVDYVFLGAHSILSNGFLYSRAGTAMIAMSAKRRNIPVLVCCESLKFSQRVQLDSVTYNELADPNDLVEISYNNPMERRGHDNGLLNQFIKERELFKKQEMDNNNKGKNKQQQQQKEKQKQLDENKNKLIDNKSNNILDDWKNLPSLNIVNILYDLTPPEYIKKIITEFGALPPSSVPVILREYKGSA